MNPAAGRALEPKRRQSDGAPAVLPPLRLGISSCLLGSAVRYDGRHKRDAFLADLLGAAVQWVPVCPEVEAGLGVPRPAMRLVRGDTGVRLLESASGADHTRRLQTYAARRVRALREQELCGYVLKKDSPSCGMERVVVLRAGGAPKREGRGLYASALLQAYPNLPVEEEGRLQDLRLRENFIERVFAYQRLRALFGRRWTRGQVVAFHSLQKLQLLAHSPEQTAALGRLVAAPARLARGEFRERYESQFMAALARPTSRGRSANALQHAAGHLVQRLDAHSRAELAALIDDYRRGMVPLIVPITLLRHHVRREEIHALRGQTFLEPHPLLPERASGAQNRHSQTS